MLTIPQALELIEREVRPGPVEQRELREALNLRLAEPVVSSIDSPPFDKSMMDGFAIRSADVTGNGTKLHVIGQVTAGEVSQASVAAGEVVRIMTGAMIPAGADAVVRLEDTQSADDAAVSIQLDRVKAGQFIIRRGSSMQVGAKLLPMGQRLSPAELGLLAELGIARVAVHRAASVAIIATGNELVPITESPGPGQIRNSNETMLTAQVQRLGGTAVPLGIAPDAPEGLKARIQDGLQHDFVCLSGGVSAGILDLVPKVLRELGVREVFHKVDIKPGKPIWFGVREAGGRRQYIFGLPGNPVSSMVCCELFVRHALRIWQGAEATDGEWIKARWANPLETTSDRTTLLPCTIDWILDGPRIRATPWKGSFDLKGTLGANGLALVPAGNHVFQIGDPIDVLPCE